MLLPNVPEYRSEPPAGALATLRVTEQQTRLPPRPGPGNTDAGSPRTPSRGAAKSERYQVDAPELQPPDGSNWPTSVTATAGTDRCPWPTPVDVLRRGRLQSARAQAGRLGMRPGRARRRRGEPGMVGGVPGGVRPPPGVRALRSRLGELARRDGRACHFFAPYAWSPLVISSASRPPALDRVRDHSSSSVISPSPAGGGRLSLAWSTMAMGRTGRTTNRKGAPHDRHS
jgi:hypothetical protein